MILATDDGEPRFAFPCAPWVDTRPGVPAAERIKMIQSEPVSGEITITESRNSAIHVLNQAIDYNDFPFGSLPTQTLSNDILTVNIFIVSVDSSTFIINNQAPISERNKEMSNGFIHVDGFT